LPERISQETFLWKAWELKKQVTHLYIRISVQIFYNGRATTLCTSLHTIVYAAHSFTKYLEIVEFIGRKFLTFTKFTSVFGTDFNP